MLCDKVTEQLSAFLDGELTAEETPAVRSHLDSCAACRRDLEDLRKTVRAVSALPRVSAPPGLRAKVLAGLPSAREERVPRWRTFWGAAAAILIAAVIMLLTRPPNPVQRSRAGGAGGSIPAVATVSSPPATESETPATAVEQRREMANSAQEKQVSAAKELAGGPPAGGMGLTERATPKAAAPGMAVGPAGAGARAAAAAPAEIATEEIALPSANPESAFATARALAAERGWLAPGVTNIVPIDRAKGGGAPVQVMLLRLKRSQVPLLKEVLAKAGLPRVEERFRAKGKEFARAAAAGSSMSDAVRKAAGPDELAEKDKNLKPAAASAAPVGAAGPAAAAGPTAPLTPGAPAGSASPAAPTLAGAGPRGGAGAGTAQKAAEGADEAAVRQLRDKDAFVWIVLTFPRADAVLPAAPAAATPPPHPAP